VEKLLVRKKPELTGGAVKSAMLARGNMGQPEIEFTLNSEGADRFAQITRDNVGRRLAIVLDHELYSAPRINGEIPPAAARSLATFPMKKPGNWPMCCRIHCRYQ